jgi:hypothetical protein
MHDMIQSKSRNGGRRLFAASMTLLLGFTAGCEAQARRDARVLSGMTGRVQNMTNEFIKARDGLDQARERNMDRLEQSTSATKHEILFTREVWQTADLNDRTHLFDNILAASQQEADQASQLEKLKADEIARVNATKSQINVRSDKLGDVAKTLSQLTEPPSSAETAIFYAKFFQSVASDIKQSKAAATQSAANAKTALDQQAKK